MVKIKQFLNQIHPKEVIKKQKYAASYLIFSFLLATASCSSKTESKAEEKTESQKTFRADTFS